jgi:hypothetical protein
VTESKAMDLSAEPEGAIAVIKRTGSCVSNRNWNLGQDTSNNHPITMLHDE